MVQMYPFIIADFEKALGQDLGVTRLPTFSDGPLAGKAAGNSFHNWVIPAKAKNPDLAFAYVKIASDDQAGRRPGLDGRLPAGQQAGARRGSPTPTSSSSPGSVPTRGSRCSTA